MSRRTHRTSIRLFALIALLALASAVSAQVSVALTKVGEPSLGTSQGLADETLEILGELESKLGLTYTGPLSLVLATDAASFESYSRGFTGAHHEVFGFYAPPELDPHSGGVPTIALNLAQIIEARARPRSVYKHELVHAVLHQHILNRLRPLWFEEGLAQWASETPFETALRELGHASGMGDDPPSLHTVSEWMRDPSTIGLAYAHGLAAVQMLENRHGDDGIRRLLAAMRDESKGGSSARFEELYQRIFDSSFTQFQEDFVRTRARTDWTRVLGFVGANLWALLMLLGALIAIIALHRKRKREQALMAGWQEQDDWLPHDPAWAASPAPEASPPEDAAMEEHDELFDDPFEDVMAEHDELYDEDPDEWKKRGGDQ